MSARTLVDSTAVSGQELSQRASHRAALHAHASSARHFSSSAPVAAPAVAAPAAAAPATTAPPLRPLGEREDEPASRVSLDPLAPRVSTVDTFFWGPALNSFGPSARSRDRFDTDAAGDGGALDGGAYDSRAARQSRHSSRQALYVTAGTLANRFSHAALSQAALPADALALGALPCLAVEADDPALGALFDRAIADALRHDETSAALELFNTMRRTFRLVPCVATYAAVLGRLWAEMTEAARREHGPEVEARERAREAAER